MDISNYDRSIDAAAAIAVHNSATGIQDEGDLIHLTDILCNLMHWADENMVCYDDALRIARGHYTTELNGCE